MRPYLREQLASHHIDRLGILIEQTVDRQIIGRRRSGIGSGLTASRRSRR
jgi:hypothetical protein